MGGGREGETNEPWRKKGVDQTHPPPITRGFDSEWIQSSHSYSQTGQIHLHTCLIFTQKATPTIETHTHARKQSFR